MRPDICACMWCMRSPKGTHDSASVLVGYVLCALIYVLVCGVCGLPRGLKIAFFHNTYHSFLVVCIMCPPCVSLYVFLYPDVCPYVCPYMCPYMCISTRMCPCVSLSVFMYPDVCPSLYVPLYMSSYVSLYV
jgi:hypothetical protein